MKVLKPIKSVICELSTKIKIRLIVYNEARVSLSNKCSVWIQIFRIESSNNRYHFDMEGTYVHIRPSFNLGRIFKEGKVMDGSNHL